MLQLQLLILFALGVEVDPAHTAGALVETDVVEPFKTRTRDGLDPVVRDQEVFFPAHEQMFPLLVVFEREVGGFGRLGKRSPGGEASPVLQINLFGAAPGRVRGFEEVFRADDLAFEESRQGRVVVGQAWWSSVNGWTRSNHARAEDGPWMRK